MRPHERPTWAAELQAKAGIESLITDPYSDPLLDARTALGPSYRSVLRINSLACAWHPDSRDHNGNSGQELLRRIGCASTSFDELLAGCTRLTENMPARGQVALKNALAYDRDLHFDAGSIDKARVAWGKRHPEAEERKAFGDYVVDHLCRVAARTGTPMQMHLGTAIIQSSHPLNVAPLIELLPDESRMMIGGDNWHAEETWATLRLARRLISEVLAEKVDQGYFAMNDALRLAEKILSKNAKQFFGIG